MRERYHCLLPRCTDRSEHMRINLGSLSLSNAVSWALDDGTAQHQVDYSYQSLGAGRQMPGQHVQRAVCWHSLLCFMLALTQGALRQSKICCGGKPLLAFAALCNSPDSTSCSL